MNMWYDAEHRMRRDELLASAGRARLARLASRAAEVEVYGDASPTVLKYSAICLPASRTRCARTTAREPPKRPLRRFPYNSLTERVVSAPLQAALNDSSVC